MGSFCGGVVSLFLITASGTVTFSFSRRKNMFEVQVKMQGKQIVSKNASFVLQSYKLRFVNSLPDGYARHPGFNNAEWKLLFWKIGCAVPKKTFPVFLSKSRSPKTLLQQRPPTKFLPNNLRTAAYLWWCLAWLREIGIPKTPFLSPFFVFPLSICRRFGK